MIILLDLNYTLIANSQEKHKPFLKQIQHETYRQWLIDLLIPHHVILMTARPAEYFQETLASLQKKTNWQPQEAYFNEYKLAPPVAKERMLKKYVFPKHGSVGTQFFALESNPKTRSMYERYEIPAQPVASEPWTTLPFK